MQKIISILFILIICFLLAGCNGWNGDFERSGDYNMQYDLFRGGSSSVVNQVQLESIRKCLERFDFLKYRKKIVDIEVNAPNEFVTQQINTLMNIIFIKNEIKSPKKEYDEKGNLKPYKYDYLLKINAICGGYHFYQGVIFEKYESNVRIVILENTYDGKVKYFDSDYQNSSIFKPVFTGEFRVSLYIIFFLIIFIFLYRINILPKIK